MSQTLVGGKLFLVAYGLAVVGAWHVVIRPTTRTRQSVKAVLLGCWITGAVIIWLQTFWAILHLPDVTFNRILVGLLVATLWTGMTAGLMLFVTWLRLGANRRQPELLLSLITRVQASAAAPEVKSQQLRQVGWSVFAISALSLTGLALLASCAVKSCQTDLIRPRLIFIMIGCAIAVSQLFLRLRVTGRRALAVAAVVAAVTLFLIGRVLGWV